MLCISGAILFKRSIGPFRMNDIVRSTYIPAESDLFLRPPRSRTLTAWKPFFQCQSTIFTIDHSDIGDEYPEWRMFWVYLVVMFRTVGHVLDKVDSNISSVHSAVIRHRWSEWKQNKRDSWIFWEFIEEERNNILKSFDFGVSVSSGAYFHDELGLSGRELIGEAAYWWRHQLEEIERDIAAS